MVWSRRSLASPATNDWSILSVLIGQHFRCCRQEYPVPKSSAAKRTPICRKASRAGKIAGSPNATDRKSTRLNSSHLVISYAVFCLKKKKKSKQKNKKHMINVHAAVDINEDAVMY